MRITTKKYQWNVAKLVNVLKYYLKSFVTEEDLEVLGNVENLTLLNDEQVLEKLRNVLRRNSILKSYGPADVFLENLEKFQNFANNHVMFGVSNNVKFSADNHPFTYPRFIPKTECYQLFVETVMYTSKNQILDRLIAISWANRVNRGMRNKFEMVSRTYLANMNAFIDTSSAEPIKLHKLDVHTPWEKVEEQFCKYFLKGHDDDLIDELKLFLSQLAKDLPFSKHVREYEQMLDHMGEFTQIAFVVSEANPICTLPDSMVKKIPENFSLSVRCFPHSRDRYFLVREAVSVMLSQLRTMSIPPPMKFGNLRLETAEEELAGVITTVNQAELNNVWKSVIGVDLERSTTVTIVEQIVKNRDDITTPLMSYDAGHMKPAFETFVELFDDVCVSLRLFERAKPANLPKIVEYFENLPFIRIAMNDFFFVEMKAAERMRLEAKKYLAQFATEPILHMTHLATPTSDISVVANELHKMSRTLALYSPLLESAIFNFRKNRDFERFGDGHLPRVLVEYARNAIIDFHSEKLLRFMYSQDRNNLEFTGSPVVNVAPDAQPAVIDVAKIATVENFEVGVAAGATKSTLSVVTEDKRRFCVESVVYDRCWERVYQRLGSYDQKLAELYRKSCNTYVPIDYLYEEKEVLEIVDKYYEKFQEITSPIQLTSQELKKTFKFKFDAMWNKYAFDLPTRILKEAEISWSGRCKNDETLSKGEHFKNLLTLCQRLRWATTPACLIQYLVPKRKVTALRILREPASKNDDDWHLLGYEVVSLIMEMMRVEKKWSLRDREKLEAWERSWSTPRVCATVSIAQFREILNIMGVRNHRFLLIPDIEMSQKEIELPFLATEFCFDVSGPDGHRLMHQYHAQLYLFEKLIFLNAKRNESWIQLQLAIIGREIRPGYTKLSDVEKLFEKLKSVSKAEDYEAVEYVTPCGLSTNNIGSYDALSATINEIFKKDTDNSLLKDNLMKVIRINMFEGHDREKMATYLASRPPNNYHTECGLRTPKEVLHELEIKQSRRMTLNMKDLEYLDEDSLIEAFRCIVLVNFADKVTTEKFVHITALTENFDPGQKYLTANDTLRLFCILTDKSKFEKVQRRLGTSFEFKIGGDNRYCDFMLRRVTASADTYDWCSAASRVASGNSVDVEQMRAFTQAAKNRKTSRKHAFAAKISRHAEVTMERKLRLRELVESKKAALAAVAATPAAPAIVVGESDSAKSSKNAKKRARKAMRKATLRKEADSTTTDDEVHKPTGESPRRTSHDSGIESSADFAAKVAEAASTQITPPVALKIEIPEEVVQDDASTKAAVSEELINVASKVALLAEKMDSAVPTEVFNVASKFVGDKKNSKKVAPVAKTTVEPVASVAEPSAAPSPPVASPSPPVASPATTTPPIAHLTSPVPSHSTDAANVAAEPKRVKLMQKRIATLEAELAAMTTSYNDEKYEKEKLQEQRKEFAKSIAKIEHLESEICRKDHRIETILQDAKCDRSANEVEVDKIRKSFVTKISSLESESNRKDSEIRKLKHSLQLEKLARTEKVEKMEREMRELRAQNLTAKQENMLRLATKNAEDNRLALQAAEIEWARIQKETAEKLKAAEAKIGEMAVRNNDLELEVKNEQYENMKIRMKVDELRIRNQSLDSENNFVLSKLDYLKSLTCINLTKFELDVTDRSIIWETRAREMSNPLRDNNQAQ